jgi:hypothetical protein
VGIKGHDRTLRPMLVNMTSGRAGVNRKLKTATRMKKRF